MTHVLPRDAHISGSSGQYDPAARCAAGTTALAVRSPVLSLTCATVAHVRHRRVTYGTVVSHMAPLCHPWHRCVTCGHNRMTCGTATRPRHVRRGRVTCGAAAAAARLRSTACAQ